MDNVSSQSKIKMEPVSVAQNAGSDPLSNARLEQRSVGELQAQDKRFLGESPSRDSKAIGTEPMQPEPVSPVTPVGPDHRILKQRTIELDQDQVRTRQHMTGPAGMNVKAINRHHALQAAHRKASLEGQARQAAGEEVLDLRVQASGAPYAARASKNQKREAVYNKQPGPSKTLAARQKDMSNSQGLLKISAVIGEPGSPSPMQPPYTGSAAEEDIEQSPPVTAPKTVDTDFLPGQKQGKQKGMVMPLGSLRDGPGAPRSNIISKENMAGIAGSPLRSPVDKLIIKSVSNNERILAINTGTHDEFQQSTDLDQVHQRHFNEYFASRTKTPQKDHRGMDVSPGTEVRSANISNQDSLNKLPSPTGSHSPIHSLAPSPRPADAQAQPVQALWQEPQFAVADAPRNRGDSLGDSLHGTAEGHQDMFGSIHKSVMLSEPSVERSLFPDNPAHHIRMNRVQREHDKLLDEVRDNHFQQVQNVVG